MKKIYKYPMVDTGRVSLWLPLGAEILCVQIDVKDGNPYIWAIVDTGGEVIEEVRFFEVFYTGEEIDEDVNIVRKYIGTYQYSNGLVCHLFERVGYND
jgi:hypothetical protein